MCYITQKNTLVSQLLTFSDLENLIRKFFVSNAGMFVFTNLCKISFRKPLYSHIICLFNIIRLYLRSQRCKYMQRLGKHIEEQIIKRMSIDNPWWITCSIAEDYKEMPSRMYLEEFYPLITDLAVRRAVILMGARRVGKTVMIYHAIDRLIREGVDPHKIIYVSIDTPIYNNNSLEELFAYARRALKNEENYEGYYVFFDEIQYLKDWEVHLKSLVDTYRKVKFIASGSAAAALKMKSNESGAGRFTDFMLPPLTFFEYLNLQRLETIIVSKPTEAVPYDTINIDELNRHFIDYINYGGYPEVVFSEKIRSNPGLYIKNDIIDKVLLRDLPSLYGITDIQELNKLFVHIAFRSSNEFSYEKLATESGTEEISGVSGSCVPRQSGEEG